MTSFILCMGLWMPGVSMNTSCAPGWFTMPRMRFRVVWGLFEMMAIFSPSKDVQERGFAHVRPADDGDEA